MPKIKLPKQNTIEHNLSELRRFHNVVAFMKINKYNVKTELM